MSVTTTNVSPSPRSLLVSRDQAREMLGGISVSHLRRLMQAGELQPVFLNASTKRQRSGKLYFRYADLEALVDKYAKRAAK
ncbi:helix-turn-helix domain-containing protein [Bradyrhizobium sp. 179]|uniref:helix-turn-helix domain-containing protein n=1 Tax=Bradyrhizobium sp. 179 TaxID=2782648 RepID=UPI001FFB19FD|nr:helix-turn-helix domain-containing protein [Bradyrhizobium sp. 179]MCK1547181.1 helix-turn-helix domain-containing protein [Bradyrhizobium sp. 179]